MAILPQYDPDPAQRELGLQSKRELFAYFVPEYPRVPRVETLPAAEDFDTTWKEAETSRRDIAQLSALGSVLVNLNTFEAYLDLHRTLPGKPAVVTDWASDESFANQRLAGPNPLLIRRVSASAPLPPACKITDSHAADSDIKLATAIDERRLFICDFRDLNRLPPLGGSVFTLGFVVPKKRVRAPIAVFYWEGDRESGSLKPVAIQTDQDTDVAVFTPKSHPRAWAMAKAGVQVADAHLHQYDSHIIRTHLAMSVVKIAAERQLAEAHPVLRLLRPHFRFLLAINQAAFTQLINPGGYLDELMAPTFVDSMKMIDHFWKVWNFRDVAVLPVDLARRGMDNNGSPDIAYPYRDDGLLVFDAIRDFVKEYIDLYYRTDDDVENDRELELFVAELTDPNRLGVRNLSPDGKIETRKILAEVLTATVWTCGPQHAAVNYPQWDFLGHVPNMPLAGYADMPLEGDHPTEMELFSYFPPNHPPTLQTGTQVAIMYYLGTYRYDMLGYYQPKDFDDAPVWEAVVKFQCRLAQVGGEIFRTNQRRRFAYPYLLPWNITNSTSI